jgi:mRNA-degrading endonuclease RelE of RelBE toxin-antitoxin system
MRGLDRETAQMIFAAIDRYLTTGKGDVMPLKPPLTACRLRVGDWRVLFEPAQAKNAIEVSRVLHRSVAYRRN